MSDPRSPYDVLGVPRNATVHQIRAAYVARARQAHPDLVGARGLDLMRTLNEAWAVLKDADRRAEFDGAGAVPGGDVDADAAKAPPNDPNRPFWTGAAGPPPGRAWGSVLGFGIYAGWSLGEISRRDRGYLRWLLDRPESQPYRAEIIRLIDPDAEHKADRRDRRGR